MDLDTEGPLDAALRGITTQGAQMRRCLDTEGRLLAAIKHASLMLAELRTSELSPKMYYELYIASFDNLTQLSDYLKEDHQNHHLGEIYEIVQYAGSILPRLYLMITVGSAYLSIPDAPVKGILKDMLEMCRGVQHPLRGLFLRYYLGQRTRDYLPSFTDASNPGAGTLNDSIKFIITNFVEMNKLWVRIQHQGHSSERNKRFAERKELQTIVGSNLLRLAQLDGITLELFRARVLPAILEQLVQSRDVLAQEYLLDVVCQTFPAEFHLGTLDMYLGSLSSLNPQTSVSKVLLVSIERMIQFVETRKLRQDFDKLETTEAAKGKSSSKGTDNSTAVVGTIDVDAESNNSGPKSTADKPEEPRGDQSGAEENVDTKADTEMAGVEVAKDLSVDVDSEGAATNDTDKSLAKQVGGSETKETPKPAMTNAAAQETASVFKLVPVYEAAIKELGKSLTFADRAVLIEALSRLSFLLDMKNENRIHMLLLLLQDPKSNTVQADISVEQLLLSLLRYLPLLEIISLDVFKRLLAAQSKSTQQAVASRVLEKVLSQKTSIIDVSVAKQIFDMFGLLTKSGGADNLPLAELVHLLYTEDFDIGTELLQMAHRSLRDGGVAVVQQTYPAIVTVTLRLLRANTTKDPGPLLKFVGRTINDMATVGGQAEKAYRLYIFAASVADQLQAEGIAYDFFVQAFEIYEEYISDSRSQYQAICLVGSALQKTRLFSEENYENLASRVILYGQRLLKKPDQCRAVYLGSHLWLATDILGRPEDERATLYRNDAKILETLQRGLRVADSSTDVTVSVELFVEVLNRYLYFLDHDASSIGPKDVSSLIDLIRQNIDTNSDETTSDSPRKYFERTLEFIRQQVNEVPRFAEIEL